MSVWVMDERSVETVQPFMTLHFILVWNSVTCLHKMVSLSCQYMTAVTFSNCYFEIKSLLKQTFEGQAIAMHMYKIKSTSGHAGSLN